MQFICIAGMHRSGTSLMARMVNLLGVDLGSEEEMIAPGPENPRGFWENTAIKRLNEAVLQTMGGTWNDPPLLNNEWGWSEDLSAHREEGARLLSTVPRYEPFGWKDPRNCLTLPFWHTVANIEKFIIVVRDPSAVAISLRERNGLTVESCSELWVYYYLSVLGSCVDPLIVHYEDALTEPDQTAQRLADYIGLGEPSTEVLSNIHQFVDSDLNRSNSVGDREPISGLAADIYERLRMERPIGTSLTLPYLQDYCRAAKMLPGGGGLAGPLTSHEGSVQAQVEMVQGELDELESRVGSLAESNERLEQELAAAEQGRTLEKNIRESVEGKYKRLASRRSVRLALKLAGYSRPLIMLVRSHRRSRGTEGGWKSVLPVGWGKISGSRVGSGEIARSVRGVAGTGRGRRRGKGPTGQVGVSNVTLGGGRPKHVNIVVPVHNAVDDVRGCLESVIMNTNLRTHKLIIVDDASDEETAGHVREVAADVGAVLIRREVQGGFGVAANAGIEACWLPWVVLLNSDTIVGPGWVERLVDCGSTDERIGIVGPWSNAASWQSVPELVDAEGGWSVNPSIGPEDVEEINRRLARRGLRLHPKVPLVNGFCYLIKSDLLAVVGSLDTVSFPRGYGEEDDLCIRASRAGFFAAIADDCFVYHAKSKSYSREQRDVISKESQGRLEKKYGVEELRTRTRQMRVGRELVRARSYASLLVQRDAVGTATPGPGPRVGWVQPHLKQVGGIRRTIELSNRLCAAGWDVNLIKVDPAEESAWLACRAGILSVEEAASTYFDLLIVSDPDVMDAVGRLQFGQGITYHLDAYYMYRTGETTPYYDFAGSVPNIANSHWTAELVRGGRGIEVDAIIPGGVDTYQFAPRPVEVEWDVVCYGSSRARKRTWMIEEACDGLRLGKLSELSVSQGDLSWHYNRGRVFVSASSQEGFNLPCLEAMACGVPVVCTDDGGSSEYVRDGENAVVVSDPTSKGLRRAVEKVFGDEELQSRLIRKGLQTANSMSWDDVASRFGTYLLNVGATVEDGS